MQQKSRITKSLLSLLGLCSVLLLWQSVVWLSIWETNLLPTPFMVGKALKELLSDGTLWEHIHSSLYRFITGYALSALIALPLGLLLGWFVSAFNFLNPLLQLIRPISPIAWFPFIVLWFNIGDASAIAIISIAVFFPILFSTIASVKKIDDTYLKVSANFGLSRLQFFYKIALPFAFPYITVGLHMAIGTGWVFLVAGEMVGAQSGLGYLIIDARNNIRPDMVLAGILVIGVIGWLLDTLMQLFETFIYRQWGINKE